MEKSKVRVAFLVSHTDKMRGRKKVLFHANAKIKGKSAMLVPDKTDYKDCYKRQRTLHMIIESIEEDERTIHVYATNTRTYEYIR